MKTSLFFASLATATLALAPTLSAQSTPVPEPGVPVAQGASASPQAAAETSARTYEQSAYIAGSLIAPEKARQVVDAFKTAYTKLGSPRVLIYVNRELVDEASGLRVTGRKERTESVQGETKSAFEADANAPKPAAPANAQTQINVAVGGGNTGSDAATPGKGSSDIRGTKVVAENTYSFKERTSAGLADKQTVRDVERLFGRPLRAGGAKLADQRVAAQLIADKPLEHFTAATNEAARKDREALTKVADVVIEILISSRSVTVPQVSGNDQVVTMPDIQATAIRLSDAAILGQASASDILGKSRQAADRKSVV